MLSRGLLRSQRADHGERAEGGGTGSNDLVLSEEGAAHGWGIDAPRRQCKRCPRREQLATAAGGSQTDFLAPASGQRRGVR
jgi:hypothetical protein